MGAASFLASVARHSLRPMRHEYSKFAGSGVHNIVLSDPHQPAGAVQLLSSFHMDLAERLQQLQLHGTGNAHFNWLFDALASTLSTHSSLQLALTAAASTCAASAAAALSKHRADEVLCMLDACTALKQVADDMERQLGCLDHALQSVGHALNSEKPLSSGRLRAAARRLSACLMQDTNLLCVTGKHYRPLAEARDSLLLAAKKELQISAATPDLAATLLSQAIDGAMLTSLLVLASAVSSHAPPLPSRRKSSGIITSACKMIIKYLGAKSLSAPWATPLRQLHRDLRQEEMSAAGGAIFQERQGLHLAATKLHAAITTPGVELALVKQSVKSLRKSLREAQACITVFRMQIASFFQALIALRLTLLDA